MRPRIAPTLLAASLGLQAWHAAHAQANLLSNGSFESPQLGSSQYDTYLVGSTAMRGWTVVAPGRPDSLHVTLTSGSFTQGAFSFPAADGTQWLDLTGAYPSDNDREGVEQLVPTRAGSAYAVSFEVGNVFDASGVFGATSSIDVLVDGALIGSCSNSTASTTQSWTPCTRTFTATAPWTKIAFINADPHSDNSNGLDDARVTLATPGPARDGDLDGAFGGNGVAAGGAHAVDWEPSRPVVQPDGKIVYCTTVNSGAQTGDDFLVVRVNANGTPDTSFSADGKASIDFAEYPDVVYRDVCRSIVLQPDGKIVVAGWTQFQPFASQYAQFAVARLNGDGSLDPTFADHGKARVWLDGSSYALGQAVALQADGKLVVAGNHFTDSTSNDSLFAVARLLPDGSLDASFAGIGTRSIPFGTGVFASAAAVATDAAGRIVVAGTVQVGGGDFGVARLLGDGSLDGDFNASGRVTVGFDIGATRSDYLGGMAIQRDGRIVLAGSADVGSAAQNWDWAIARLRTDGGLDADFGDGGKVVLPFDLDPSGYDFAFDVVAANGKLLIGGYAATKTSTRFGALARLDRSGRLDAGFGNGGRRLHEFSSATWHYDYLFGVAVAGSRIIVSGYGAEAYDAASNTTTYDNSFIARLLDGDAIFASGFD